MSIKDRIIKVIAKAADCEVDELKDETSFAADLGFDSLDRIELSLSLEEEFAAELKGEVIPDELFADEAKTTVGQCAELVKTFLETLI